MLAMLRQPQKRAGTPGTACCLHSAAQQGNRPLKCSQEGCLPEYILSHGLSVRSSMCNSSMLDRAGNRYRHNENRRQSWDGRVYHCPALLGPASARQLKHSQTERVDKRSAANCCSCWFPKPQAAARDCVKDSTEDLELVSLLQVLLVYHFIMLYTVYLLQFVLHLCVTHLCNLHTICCVHGICRS